MNLKRTVMGALAFVLIAPAAFACDNGTVRDAAFHARRDTHRLCLFATKDSEEAGNLEKRLSEWLDANGRDLNVAFERVNVDDAGVNLQEYGLPSAPPQLPATALIGEFQSPRRPFVISHWTPAPSDPELAALATSPVREALAASAIDNFAVVLYAPGPGAPQEAALNAALSRYNEQHNPGLALMKMDRNDAAESLLASFAGVRPTDGDWAGIVFGKAKLLAPPLRGADITADHVNELLDRLAVACTCLQQSISLGVDIPMRWTPELESKAAAMLAAPAPQQGYTELTLQPAAPKGAKALVAEIPRDDRHMMVSALAPLAGAGIAAASTVAVILWRVRRRRLEA